MVPPLEESEDGNRASFSRWEKRSVISNHFTELNLEITEMEMLLKNFGRLFRKLKDFFKLRHKFGRFKADFCPLFHTERAEGLDNLGIELSS